MPPHAASTSGRSGFPDWVLLDKIAHMGRCRDNTTTAAAVTSASCPIEVSFVVADPPALTRCFVDCPHLTWGDFFEEPPRIAGADGAFLLITVIFPKHPDRSDFTDLFVYKSGRGIPSLELLPRPYPVGYLSNYVGVLSCGDHCLVVVPQQRFNADRRMSYDLHIFSSKTKSWSTKATRLASGVKLHCDLFKFTKVFALGGGSMAWVDLRNCILLCDCVAGDPEVRLIQLPPLMPINVKRLGVGFDGTMPCLDGVRDVTFRNGWFRFIEMGYPLLDARSTAQLNFQWKATMFKRRVWPDNWGWQPCGTVDSASLSPADSCLLYLFPEIWKENKLALSNVISLFPTIDLYHDDVVYMMTKMDAADPNGWVLAVNTESKELQKIVPFFAESLHLHRSYMQCAFSKHVSQASGACNADGWKHNICKEVWMPLVLYVISVLLVQQKLRQFEKYFTKETPSRCVVWSLQSGAASTMNVHIHQVAQYATTIGLGKAASDAEKTFQRASKDVKNLLLGYCWNDPSVCSKAVGDKINVAIGALDKLLLMLPSSVLNTGRSMISVNESVNEEEGIAERFAPPHSYEVCQHNLKGINP